MVVLIFRSISRQENELEERKRNLQCGIAGVYIVHGCVDF
nr:MAG TPA: hypothetical protein [Caudoviricetes sp.]